MILALPISKEATTTDSACVVCNVYDKGSNAPQLVAQVSVHYKQTQYKWILFWTQEENNNTAVSTSTNNAIAWLLYLQ